MTKPVKIKQTINKNQISIKAVLQSGSPWQLQSSSFSRSRVSRALFVRSKTDPIAMRDPSRQLRVHDVWASKVLAYLVICSPDILSTWLEKQVGLGTWALFTWPSPRLTWDVGLGKLDTFHQLTWTLVSDKLSHDFINIPKSLPTPSTAKQQEQQYLTIDATLCPVGYKQQGHKEITFEY